MAEFKDVMQDLGIDPDVLDPRWETYFIASQYKYSFKKENQKRYELTWYKRANKWLDLSNDQLELLARVGARLIMSEELYEWSGFIRYLLYDTLILQEDEALLIDLIPEGLSEYTGMFILISFLSGFDQSLAIYKARGIPEDYLMDIYGIVKTIMNEYYDKNGLWGTTPTTYIPRLAWGSLYVFSGLAFSLSKAKLPGEVYRNKRSGEILMFADANQIYYEGGQRVSSKYEKKVKSNIKDTKVVLADTKKAEDAAKEDKTAEVETAEDANDNLKIVKSLPKGVWESVFYTTEEDNIVANTFTANGLASKAARILDSEYWDKILSHEDYVVNIYIPRIEKLNFNDLFTACFEAAHFFFAEDKLEALDQEVFEMLEDTKFKDLEENLKASINRVKEIRKSKNKDNIYPLAFIHESSALSSVLVENDAVDEQLRLFIDVFKLYCLPENRDASLAEVFGLEALRKPVVLWDDDYNLQKVYKQLVMDDYRVSISGGFFFLDNITNMLDTSIDIHTKYLRAQEQKKAQREAAEENKEAQSTEETAPASEA